MSAPENLVVDVRGSVLRVCINRPAKRNALSRAVLEELGRVFEEHGTDMSLRAAVITGAGDKSFAAGGDLQEFASLRSEGDAQALFRRANEALGEIRHFTLPVIAALNGLALGGGAELALACDFRVAAAHAGIGFVQGRLNISTGFGGGTDLFELLGTRRALRVLLEARILDADEAREIGLFDAVAARNESLEDCIERFLEPIRAQAPHVLRAFKKLAWDHRLGLTRAARERRERTEFVRTWVHPDHWAAADQLVARKS